MRVSKTRKRKPSTESLESGENTFLSPLRYPGGKQRAVKQIANMLPEAAHEYREPMVGGGSVFFYARNKNLASRYWINDQFSELVSFWKIVQNDSTNSILMEELETLRKSFNSSDEIKEFFYRCRKEETSDSYRQAFLFFFFNRVTFSGTTKAGGFSSQASLNRFTKSSIERLRNLPEALKNTSITEGDFERVIRKPGKDVFIFLDPPYSNAKRLYGKNGALHDFDHKRLASILKDSNHKFLMTYDDSDEIRNLYSWADVSHWNLQYGMNNCNQTNTSKLGEELFIKNY